MLHKKKRKKNFVEGAYKPYDKERYPLRRKIFLGGGLLVLIGSIGLHFYLHHQSIFLSSQKKELLIAQKSLTHKITLLHKDPSMYEEIARQKYALIKDHEYLIVFEN